MFASYCLSIFDLNSFSFCLFFFPCSTTIYLCSSFMQSNVFGLVCRAFVRIWIYVMNFSCSFSFVCFPSCVALHTNTHTHTCNADKEKKRNLDSRYSKGNIDRSSLFSSSVRCFIRYSTVCLCVFFFCVCSICGSHSLTFLSLFIIVCAILLTMPLMCCCFYVHVMFARFFCFREWISRRKEIIFDILKLHSYAWNVHFASIRILFLLWASTFVSLVEGTRFKRAKIIRNLEMLVKQSLGTRENEPELRSHFQSEERAWFFPTCTVLSCQSSNERALFRKSDAITFRSCIYVRFNGDCNIQFAHISHFVARWNRFL